MMLRSGDFGNGPGCCQGSVVSCYTLSMISTRGLLLRIFVRIFLTLVITPPVFADKFQYPPQRISARGVKEIRINGVRGKLNLKGNHSKSFKIKVSHSKSKRFEDWSLSVDRQGDVLVFEVFNVALGAQWKHSVRAEFYPEFDVELEGPSLPAVIAWRDGALNLTNWSSNVEAAFLSGFFEVRRFKGDLNIQAGEGQVSVFDAEGQLHIKGEKGRVDLRNVRSSVELTWLQGVLRGENLSGPVTLDLASGNAQLKGIAGQLKISGVNSEWLVHGAAPADIEVKTETGPVKVKWSGGAKVFLTSAKGVIQVPKPYLVESRDGVKVAEFRKEKNPRGQVFVRTQSGTITWQ